MVQKTRRELQRIFKSGAKPSSEDFKDFIESTLNISDDGLEKSAGANSPLKISAQGTQEKLLDFYVDEVKTWSISQRPSEDNPGFNLSNASGSKLFIADSNGNVGIGTTAPTAKLEINGNLKLQSGVTVNEFSTDGTLDGESDLVIPTEQAVKTYADTKALLAGSSTQDFTANNLTINGNLGIGKANPTAKLEINGDLKLKYGVAVNKFSTDGNMSNNSDLAIPTEQAVKTYVNSRVPDLSGKASLSGSFSQDFNVNNLFASGSVEQRLDVIACGGRGGNYGYQNLPIKRYFYNQLHGKPTGTIIQAISDLPGWRDRLWIGWIDDGGKIRVYYLRTDQWAEAWP